MLKIAVILLLGIVQLFAGLAKSAPTKGSASTQYSTNSDSACDTEVFGSTQNSRNTMEDYTLQQLFLKGFRKNADVNSFSLSQGEFTSDINNAPPCIVVRYIIQCNDTATSEICRSMSSETECPKAQPDEWLYMWTVFNAKSTTGDILLQLTIYDLRVYGFELCDAYKMPVNISITLESAEHDFKRKCYDMCKVLTDFTRLLPVLSDNEQGVDASSTLTAKGYALHWGSGSTLKSHGDGQVTTSLVSLVIISKFLIVAFCYEAYKKVLKHQIHRKTHNLYYIYWGAQLLILVGIVYLIYFAATRQKNISSLYTFITSLGVDSILVLIAASVLTCHRSNCCKPAINSDTNTNANHEDDDTFLVPPPLSLCCELCCHASGSTAGNVIRNTPLIPGSTAPPKAKKCACTHIQTGWTIFTNIISLFTFVTFVSYFTQALPAIAISYYINPTASLIRIGFFELSVIILMIEIAFLIFLLDKCLWLCYVHVTKEIPEEVYDNSQASETSNSQAVSSGASVVLRSSSVAAALESPVSGGNSVFFCSSSVASTSEISGLERDATAKRNIKYIDMYLVNQYEAKLIGCGRRKCSNKYCHWLFVTIFFQIIVCLLLIGMSVPLLYILMNIVIDQTSRPADEFKDILAIVPTIALNGWLLFKHVNFSHALKDMISKAKKQAMETHGDSEHEGGHNDPAPGNS